MYPELPLVAIDPVRLIMALLLLLVCVLTWLVFEPLLVRLGVNLPVTCLRSKTERSFLRLLVMIEMVVLICQMFWIDPWSPDYSMFIRGVSGFFTAYGIFLAIQTFVRLRRFKHAERVFLERLQDSD